MDIEEFYSADERRRQSAEVEFGNNWFDTKGSRYELSWIEDTGELYAMLELVPEADSWTPFGDIEVENVKVDSLLVTVLAVDPDPSRRSSSSSTAGPSRWRSPTASTGWPSGSRPPACPGPPSTERVRRGRGGRPAERSCRADRAGAPTGAGRGLRRACRPGRPAGDGSMTMVPIRAHVEWRDA